MKLGILTFHRSINYGAYMQCYALSHEIMHRFPTLDVEVVDFEMLTKHIKYTPKKRGIIDLLVYRQNSIQYKRFQEDLVKLPLSKETLITNNYEEVFEYLNGRYDILVVGSDAVWAYNKNLGLKNPYFLFGDKLQCHKMSYAASAYSLDQSRMTQKEVSYIGECLNSFEYIGVRDEETQKLVQRCAPTMTVYRNCDPTVLLPTPSRKEALSILREKGVDTNKQVVTIMSRGAHYSPMIQNYLGTRKYEFINLYQRESLKDMFSLKTPKFIYDLSPLEWYKIYAGASLNITTMFHGTLLALKSGVPTISFDRTNLSTAYVSKIKQLLTDLDLRNCWFSNNEVNADQEERVMACVQSLIDNHSEISSHITKAIQEEGKKSESFFIKLEEIISNG